MPWHPETFELPAAPTDQDLRRAFRVLLAGGALGGDPRWCVASVRALNELGPHSQAGPDEVEAYERAAALAPKSRPSGVLGKAGRRLVGRASARQMRVGDVVPADATDEKIRQMYAPGDAEAIIEFRRQLEQLGRVDRSAE